ncbi:Y-family DNA polymerase [Mycoplasma sp. 5370]
MSNKKVILHIDIDSFFVSAERKNNKLLEKKEIAIAYNRKNSIVVSLSYEAKNKGAKVPWLLSKVKEIIPNIVVVEPNYNLYLKESENFFDFLKRKYTKKIEIISIDECFMDATELVKKFNNNLNFMISSIQNDVKKFLDLPITIGVSYNKFLAKMATNLAKPFGLKILEQKDIKKEILPLSIDKCYGIGKSSYIKFQNLKIYNIEDFYKKIKKDLAINQKVHKRDFDLLNNLENNGDDFVNYKYEEPKGISQQISFDADNWVTERKVLLESIKHISRTICSNLQRKQLFSKNLFLVIYTDLEKKSKKLTLSNLTNNEEVVYNHLSKMLDQIWNEQPVKFITCGFNNLVASFSQISIIEEEGENKKIQNLITKLNNKFYKKTFMSLSEHKDNKIKNKETTYKGFGVKK